MRTPILLAALALTSPALIAGEIYKLSDQHLSESSPWSGEDLALRLVPGEDGKVKFKLPELGGHQFVKVQLDVQIAGGMGNFGRAGDSVGESDTRLKIKTGDTTLLDSSFAAMRLGQSFPDAFGAFVHPPGTGCIEPENNQGNGRVQIGGLGKVSSGNYKIDLLFPHEGDTLELDFDWEKGEGKGGQRAGFAIQINGMNVGGKDGASPYTISDLVVTTFDKAPTSLDEKAANKLLEAISGKDAPAARAALNELIGAGPAAMPFIREVFETEPDPELEGKIDALAEGLRSDEFKERTNAEAELGKLGPEAIPHLAAILADRDSLTVDVRTGLEKVKQRLEKAAKASPEQTLANRLRPALPLIDPATAESVEKLMPTLKKLETIDVKEQEAGVKVNRVRAKVEIKPQEKKDK